MHARNSTCLQRIFSAKVFPLVNFACRVIVCPYTLRKDRREANRPYGAGKVTYL